MLRVERVPKLGEAVCNEVGVHVGSVFDLFGPVVAPYAVVKPRGLSQTSLNELTGKDLYIGERYGKAREAKNVPRVRKRKVRA